jgi:hypothetical protein
MFGFFFEKRSGEEKLSFTIQQKEDTNSQATVKEGNCKKAIVMIAIMLSWISTDLESGELPSIKEDEGPDGGYGWLVVLGAFCVQVTSFDVVSSWGTIHGYI